MADRNEEYSIRLRNDRMKVGIFAIVIIEVPLLSLLVLLSLSHILSFLAFGIGAMVVSIGGMFAAFAIADLYIKRKQRCIGTG